MDLSEFKNSLVADEPSKGTSVYLQALWWDAKGDWDQSHKTIQDVPDRSASWIHAYLHRKEGDIWNADYWYDKASKKRPPITLEQEWEQLVMNFL